MKAWLSRYLNECFIAISLYLYRSVKNQFCNLFQYRFMGKIVENHYPAAFDNNVKGYKEISWFNWYWATINNLNRPNKTTLWWSQWFIISPCVLNDPFQTSFLEQHMNFIAFRGTRLYLLWYSYLENVSI